MKLDREIQAPQRDDPISADWGRRMTEAVNSARVGGGDGTITESSKLGTYVSPSRRRNVDESYTINVSGSSVIAKVTGGDAVSGYTLACYPNYPDVTTEAFSAVAFIPSISLGGYVVPYVPDGTYIIAHYMALTAIGGI